MHTTQPNWFICFSIPCWSFSKNPNKILALHTITFLMMEDPQFMQTELTGGGAGLISHRPHFHHHRYAPYPLHRPHMPSVAIPYLHSHPQQRIPLPQTTSSSASSSSSSSNHHLHHHHHHQHPHSSITQLPKTRSPSPAPPEGTHVGHLYPEILELIFQKLSVRDRGRASQVCTLWRDVAYSKSIWKGVEARLHLSNSKPKSNGNANVLFPSITRRGIRRIQVLSLRRSIKEVITGVRNLETLNLSGCYSITDNSLLGAFSQELPSLKVLNLSLCKQITDTAINRIAICLRNIEVLELGGCCNISNNSLLIICTHLKKLRHLNLRSCWQITDHGICFLAGLSKDRHFTGEPTLELVQKPAELTHLGLQDCQRLTDDALKFIAHGLPSITSINLSFCVSITDSGLKYLARMPNLHELNLRSCDNISDIGMAYLTEGGCTVNTLDVSFCDKIGDQALNHLSQGLYQLRSLSLDHCQITDEGITRIAKSLQDLEVLNIGQCNKVTDKGLQSIAEYLKNLVAIDLYGCTGLTPQAIDTVMKLPKLAKVNLGLWLVRWCVWPLIGYINLYMYIRGYPHYTKNQYKK